MGCKQCEKCEKRAEKAEKIEDPVMKALEKGKIIRYMKQNCESQKRKNCNVYQLNGIRGGGSD